MSQPTNPKEVGLAGQFWLLAPTDAVTAPSTPSHEETILRLSDYA